MFRQKHIAHAALYGAAYFLAILTCIHFLQPELNPIAEPLSRYAVDGRFSPLLVAGFCAFGIAEILLSFLFEDTQWGATLLFCTGIAMIVVGSVPMDIGPHITWKGNLHVVAATIQLSLFPIATLFIAPSQQQVALRAYSVLTGGVTLTLFCLLVIANFQRPSVFGLIQKIDIFLITAWVIIVSAWFTLSDTALKD
ncbi:MAG: DUF998 domain-containing protein [Candidatus Electrothrix sp. ATG2]|nr:DUF998 domain-containing protein [Candidatus Electrothrix sp. ATG2]